EAARSDPPRSRLEVDEEVHDSGRPRMAALHAPQEQARGRGRVRSHVVRRTRYRLHSGTPRTGLPGNFADHEEEKRTRVRETRAEGGVRRSRRMRTGGILPSMSNLLACKQDARIASKPTDASSPFF